MLDDRSLENWDYLRATRVAGLGLMISANVSFHQLFSWYNTVPSLLNVSDYLAASLITRHDYIKTNDRIQVWIRIISHFRPAAVQERRSTVPNFLWDASVRVLHCLWTPPTGHWFPSRTPRLRILPVPFSTPCTRSLSRASRYVAFLWCVAEGE